MNADPYRPPNAIESTQHRSSRSLRRRGRQVVRWLGVIGFFSLTLWVWFGVALVVFDRRPVQGNVPPAVAGSIMLPVYIVWVRAIIKGRGITCFKCVLAYCLGFIVLMLYVRGLQLGDDVVTICQRPDLIGRQRYRLLASGYSRLLSVQLDGVSKVPVT